jgi:hypothetical protein
MGQTIQYVCQSARQNRAERPSGIGSQDRIPDMIFRFLIFQWFHQFKTAGQQFFLHPFFTIINLLDSIFQSFLVANIDENTTSVGRDGCYGHIESK